MEDAGALSNSNFWAAISAIASAISAIAALLIIIQTARSQKQERQNRRAYIRVISDDMEFDENRACINLKVSNIGSHSAVNIKAKTVIADPFDRVEPLLNKEFRLSNELVPGGILDCRIRSDNPVPMNSSRQLIVFAIRYTDRILDKVFTQRFYFEWPGVVDGELIQY